MPKQLPVLLLVFAATVVLSISAGASPSVYGFNGLVLIPTAETMDLNEFNVTASIFDVTDDADVSAFSAIYGISDNFEVGFTNVNYGYEDKATQIFNGYGSGQYTFVGAKYRIMRATGNKPAIAVGVFDITGENSATLYVVGSGRLMKNCKNSPMLHLGFSSGDQYDGIFGGVSANIGDKIEVSAEYDTYEYNFGAKYAFTDALGLHVFLLDGDELGAGMSFSHRN